MANGGWVATFEDITEQMEVEQERDRNREFLDQIIENMPVTIIVKDAATRKFVLANRAAEILWSFDRHEAIGKTPHDLFGKAQADAMTEADRQGARRRRPAVLRRSIASWAASQPDASSRRNGCASAATGARAEISSSP